MKYRCEDKCIGAHAHLNDDGTWSVWFDDMKMFGEFATKEDCLKELSIWIRDPDYFKNKKKKNEDIPSI